MFHIIRQTDREVFGQKKMQRPLLNAAFLEQSKN